MLVKAVAILLPVRVATSADYSLLLLLLPLPLLLLHQSAMYEPEAAEIQRRAALWVYAFIALAGGVAVGYVAMHVGTATAAERMACSLQASAFEAVRQWCLS
jgi:hypothetical protein